jgi:hypothetical protein
MAAKDPSPSFGGRDKSDQDRVASMADEGGTAAAEMDTREQLESASRSRLKKRRRIPWMWGAAAASAAVSGVALARTVVARRIERLRAGSMAEAADRDSAATAKTRTRHAAPKKSRRSVATTARKSTRGGRQSSARR